MSIQDPQNASYRMHYYVFERHQPEGTSDLSQCRQWVPGSGNRVSGCEMAEAGESSHTANGQPAPNQRADCHMFLAHGVLRLGLRILHFLSDATYAWIGPWTWVVELGLKDVNRVGGG